MTRTIRLLSAILLGGAVAAGSGFAAAAAPKIVFKSDAFNFGKIKQGVSVSHEFVFKNEGDSLLQIGGVESSCGCTAVLVSDRKIEPGKSGTIKVTFNSTGYAGVVVKYVYVETNDPANRRIQLKVEAAVDVPPQPQIELDRYTYDAGLVLEGESIAADIVIRNRGELELQFEASLSGAAFAVKNRPAAFPIKVAPGKDATLSVKVPLTGRVGYVREFILFKSNDPLRSTISMTLGAYVVTKVQLKEIFEKYKSILR